MVVVGSYEFNLEDEYDPVGMVAFPSWILVIILIVVILLAGVGAFIARRR